MRLAGFVLLAVFTLGLSVFFPDNYYVTVVGVTACFHAMLAVALNLFIGYAGQISLGHAAFFAMGAYASAILTTRLGWSPWPAMCAGMVLAVLVAYVLARPVLRLKGHYLAMATLGFGIIVNIILVQEGGLTGGPDGLSAIPPLAVLGRTLDSDLEWYVLASTLTLVYVLMSLNIGESRTGRALFAIHGSEIAAQTVGIDTQRIKTHVFVLSAGLSAIVGSLFAHRQAFVSPDSFSFFFSVELVAMVVLGGLASTYGAVFGAVVLTFLPEVLTVFADFEIMIYGLILMGIMIFLPRGLFVALISLLARIPLLKRFPA